MKLLIFLIKTSYLLSTIAGLSTNNGTLEVEEKISNSTKEITAPETCPMFMALFPINENSTESICDCTFSYYLYYSETNSCYPAYEKGPCPPQQYLVLPSGENLAKCEKNPCLEDGLVPYNGGCYHLWASGPHCILNGYLTVNPENFSLVCTFQRNLNIITAPAKICPPGSRRNTTGQCKKVQS